MLQLFCHFAQTMPLLCFHDTTLQFLQCQYSSATLRFVLLKQHNQGTEFKASFCMQEWEWRFCARVCARACVCLFILGNGFVGISDSSQTGTQQLTSLPVSKSWPGATLSEVADLFGVLALVTFLLFCDRWSEKYHQITCTTTALPLCYHYKPPTMLI